MPKDAKCIFTDHEVKSKLASKKALQTLLSELIFHYKKMNCQLSYTFVSDDFLYQMNLNHLNHDTYTDIITFDLSEPHTETIVGDIYISIDRVKENALQQSTNYKDELHRVIIHGALHLSGFGDKTKKQKEKMRALEDEWLAYYFQN